MNPRPADISRDPVNAFVFLVMLLTCAAFWPGLGGGFIFDDYPNIVQNTLLQVSDGSWGGWIAAAFSSPATDLQRPLAMLTFAANIQATGMDPWWMKLTNLGLHTVNAGLVFGLSRTLIRMGGVAARTAGWAAVLTMAAWALNPINFTPVLLVVQRMEVLSHTFVFAALWLYGSGRLAQQGGQCGWLRIATSFILLVPAGILAKESAALTPLYALLLELALLHFRGSHGVRDRRLMAMYFAMGIPAAAAAFWVLPKAFGADAYASRQFNLIERLLTECRVLIDYIQWTLFPRLDALTLHHDDYVVSRGVFDPPSTLACLVTLATLAVCAYLLRRGRPLASLGLAWFLAAHLLTATVLPLELVFEHRNYFASLGLCLALADLLLFLSARPRWRIPAAMAGTVLLLLYGGTTFVRSLEWSDPVRLASSEASKNPRSARAAYDWARTLVILTNYDPRSPLVNQALTAIEHASLLPGSGILPEQAGLMLLSRAGLEPNRQWWSRMYEKLRTRPIGPQERSAIASMTRCQVDGLCRFPPEAMLQLFGAALERPDPEIMNIYGDYALNVLRDPDLALRLWSDAIELDPGQAQYRVNAARLLATLGRDEEANRHLAALRAIGRMGQNEARAAAIEREFPKHGQTK